MKKNTGMFLYLITVLTVILLSACLQNSHKKPEISDQKVMLDQSAIPAKHSLIRLQERPLFQKDQNERPYGMIEDIDVLSENFRVGDKPLTISETIPK